MRTVFWLLFAAAAGSVAGVLLAGHSSAPGPLRSARPAAPAAHSRAVLPETPGASTLEPGLKPLPGGWEHPLADASRSRQAALEATQHVPVPTAGPAPKDDGVVAFSSSRSLSADLRLSSTEAPPADPLPPTAPTTATGQVVPFSPQTAPPAPTGPPIEIGQVETLALSPFSATIAWETNDDTIDRIAYGFDTPTVWTARSGPARQHQVVVDGLSSSTTYTLEVQSSTVDGRMAVAAYTLTTPPLSGSTRASVGDGALRVDGRSFFPATVWAQCSDGYDANLAVGINLFMGNGCGNGRTQLDLLQGRALTLAGMHETALDGTGMLGWFLPDEWDTNLPSSLSFSDIARRVPARSGRVRFLTLTNHFYSLAEPLPQGRGMYPALVGNADMIGFDLYPLQNWCRYDSFYDVFDSQRELVAIAGGKPTFQWIEARRMDCRGGDLEPTPATVRAESWLSIAGGAHGIGYFPNNWSPEIGLEIARTNREIASLSAALLDASASASVDGGAKIRVGARVHNGAVYVIAINGGRTAASGTINVPVLGDRALVGLDGTPPAQAAGGKFSDSFGPLDVHIYVAAPPAH